MYLYLYCQQRNCCHCCCCLVYSTGDEKGFIQALEMGYSGVQLGTRFLATGECKVTDAYKQGIVRASSSDIVLTNKLAGTESSVIHTPTIAQGGLRANWLVGKLLQYPRTKGFARMFLLTRAVDGYKRAMEDASYEVWQAGKGVDGIQAVEPVEVIVERFLEAYRSKADRC